MRKRTTFVALLLSCGASQALVAPALAQQAGSAPTETADEEARVDQEIVVTGSLIADGNNSPVQVAIVTTNQMLATTPTGIADGLRKLPQFSNSTGQANSGGTGTFGAATFLNLRSIGSVRNLILFDGNRLVPSAGTGAVDVSTLPQMLVQRVDVVTGGVSAVYGSDAVSGVVNFVVDKNFSGVKTLAQAGISQRGDNATQRLGVAAGTSFAGGRGHIEGSFEYFNSDGIPSNQDRDEGALRAVLVGGGTAATPFRLITNGRLGAGQSFGGHITATRNAAGTPVTVAGLTDTNFSTNGVLTPFVHGTPVGGFESGGDGGYYAGTLFSELETKQGFLRADYELSDGLNVHAQGMLTEAVTSGIYTHFILAPITVSAQNPFLSPALQTQFANAGITTFTLQKFSTNAPFIYLDTKTRNIFGNVGFDGELGSSFKWTVDYAHNESRNTAVTRGNGNIARMAAASDAALAPASYTGQNYVLNAQGQRVVCASELTNPGLFPGCLPLNLFGPTAEDPRALAWVRGNTQNVVTQKLDTIKATLTGSPFSLPAGEVRIAATAEYRNHRLEGISNAQAGIPSDCTGLGTIARANCTFPNAWRAPISSNAAGKLNVKEVGGEILIPILKDTLLFDELSVSGAVRYTDYSTSGGVTTWKAGLNWNVTDDLRFRGTRSRDIRAPTILDLFGPVTIGRSGYCDLQTKDPVTGSCNNGPVGTVTVESGSNINLRPEIADTYTIGGVYEPKWLPGFSIAVDYFNIRVRDAITSISGAANATQLECINSNFTAAVCNLYDRPLGVSNTTAANYPTRVYSRLLNVSSLKTHGVDLDLIYRAKFAGGDWNFRVLGSYQPTNASLRTASSAPVESAGVDGLPKYRVTGFLGYKSGAFGIETQTTWHSSTRHNSDPRVVYDASYPPLPAKAFTDLTLTFDFADGRTNSKHELFLNVSNLFDTKPSVLASPLPGFGTYVTNGEDVVGRAFTVGVRSKF